MERIIRGVEDTQILAARALIQQIRAAGIVRRLADAEFKVFSQFGDDGIIQYLIHQLAPPTTFVEFGVERRLTVRTPSAAATATTSAMSGSSPPTTTTISTGPCAAAAT